MVITCFTNGQGLNIDGLEAVTYKPNDLDRNAGWDHSGAGFVKFW